MIVLGMVCVAFVTFLMSISISVAVEMSREDRNNLACAFLLVSWTVSGWLLWLIIDTF